MRKNNWKLSNNEDIKKYTFETEHKVYCTCDDGHHGVVFYSPRVDKIICRNCGHWIYKDKKTELKYKMREKGVKINE